LAPVLSQLEQSDGEGSFGERLVDQCSTGSNVDEYVHSIVPCVGHIACGVLGCDDGVVDSKQDLLHDQLRLSVSPTGALPMQRGGCGHPTRDRGDE